VQKVLAAVDWFKAHDAGGKTGVIGYGDGGMIALYAGALDERIASVQVTGYFNQREKLHEEPIDRNVWALLREFGDAELGAMVHPRHFIPDRPHDAPEWAGPVQYKSGRGGAAPGRLENRLAGAAAEVHRYRGLFDPKLKQDVVIEGGG
jgi:hypothetical protein